MKLPEQDYEHTERPEDKTPGLFIQARMASWLMATALLLLFFSFFTGYFLGQKRAIARFTHKLDQDSFADQIYAALCGMDDTQEQAQAGDQASSDDDAVQVNALGDEHEESEQHAPAIVQAGKQEDRATHGTGSQATVAQETEMAEASEQEIVTQYYAQLAGFGTAKAAQRWAQRLHQKGVPVFVKKRSSRSARGALISWYQVVTERFQDKTKLEELIATIKKEEKISDVHLVSC